MKNQLFDSQTTGEREQKLRAVLKNCAGSALDADEIDGIVNRVSPHRQYAIILYNDPVVFAQAVRLTESTTPRPVREHRPMAVVARRDRDKEDEPGRECVIHIYVPTKGEFVNEQGLQKTYRV